MMILVKEDIVVEEVEYGDGVAETLSVVIKIKQNEKKKENYCDAHTTKNYCMGD